jgi:hypothetical protein
MIANLDILIEENTSLISNLLNELKLQYFSKNPTMTEIISQKEAIKSKTNENVQFIQTATERILNEISESKAKNFILKGDKEYKGLEDLSQIAIEVNNIL